MMMYFRNQTSLQRSVHGDQCFSSPLTTRSNQHYNGRLWLFTNCWAAVLLEYSSLRHAVHYFCVLVRLKHPPPHITKCNSIDHHKVVFIHHIQHYLERLWKLQILRGPAWAYLWAKGVYCYYWNFELKPLTDLWSTSTGVCTYFAWLDLFSRLWGCVQTAFDWHLLLHPRLLNLN